ncbi:MAG: DUF4440 domain-containing protein [Acidimicrobiales bacterium]
MPEPALEQFVALEREVWNALVLGDGEADAALLTEDFLGVYPTGMATRADHADQLADGPTVESFTIADARILPIVPTAVMLSYRAIFRRPGASRDDADEQMYVSSLWCERDGGWRNVFSQDTPAATEAGARP